MKRKTRQTLYRIILISILPLVLCYAFGVDEVPARRLPNSAPIAVKNWRNKSSAPPDGGALFPDTFIF